MRRFDTLLFDLDGTLLDTRPGILASLTHTFAVLGLPPYEAPDRFLGPPLPDSFRDLCGMNEAETAEAVRIFRAKYSGEEMFHAAPFAGIADMLQTLRDAGYTLAVATCKLETYAEQLLTHFGLAPYFQFIGGAVEVQMQKSEVIAHVLAQLGQQDPARVLMIGDRENDVLGAAAHDIPCLYALWGYGSPEEAAETGACATVQTPAECARYILSAET